MERQQQSLQLGAQRLLVDHPPLASLHRLDLRPRDGQARIHRGHLDLLGDPGQELVHLLLVHLAFQRHVGGPKMKEYALEAVYQQIAVPGDAHGLQDCSHDVDLGTHIVRHDRPCAFAARQGDGFLRGLLHQVAEGHSGFVAGQSAEILPGHCHARVHLVVVQGRVDEEPEH